MGPFKDNKFIGTNKDREICREFGAFGHSEGSKQFSSCVINFALTRKECPEERRLYTESDKGICLGIPFGNKDYIKEAKRRNLDCSKVR